MEILQKNKELGHVRTPSEPKNTKRLIQKISERIGSFI